MTPLEYRKELKRIAGLIIEELPIGKGFILLTFDFNNPDSKCEYVSNTNREDAVSTMKEFIHRTEEGYGKHLDESK